MLKRKCIEQLLNWKKTNSSKALIINGARQVGKTYIVRVFGKEHYKSFIELNFLENMSLKAIFDGNLTVDEILMGIKLNFPGEKIIDGDTLLFLDEIQECPNAITALKFLAQDDRIHIIASGSALGMSYNRVTSFPVGYVDYIDMTALDFREFLWAVGIEDDTICDIGKYFYELKQIPDAIHNQMMTYMRQYMVIGGMPEVVNTFIETKDYYEADQVQRRIYRDYLADIARYAEPGVKIKAEACYKSIPLQLSKENHKFQYSLVEKKGTARKFESSIDWLLSANMAVVARNVSFVEYPLKAHTIDNSMRVYPSDIGLLICTYDFGIKQMILQDSMEGKSQNVVLKTAKGGLYEALVADMLYKSGRTDLYFYRNESGTAELEFFIENENGVVPIEVKAGKSGTKTLNNLLKKEDIVRGYKLSDQNIGQVEKKVTMPIYMGMFL